MPNKIVLGLIVLAALVQGLAGDNLPAGILPLALVVLGIAAAVMNDDGHPTAAMVAAIAAFVASTAGDGGVLNNVMAIGGYLDGILDALVIALLSGAAASVGMGIYNQLTASDDSE